jgi:hypothetical protein
VPPAPQPHQGDQRAQPQDPDRPRGGKDRIDAHHQRGQPAGADRDDAAEHAGVPPIEAGGQRLRGQDQADDRYQENGQGDPGPAAHAEVARQRRRLPRGATVSAPAARAPLWGDAAAGGGARPIRSHGWMLPPPTKPGIRRYRLRSHRPASKQERPSPSALEPVQHWQSRNFRANGERRQPTSLHLGTPSDIVSGLCHPTSQLNAFAFACRWGSWP